MNILAKSFEKETDLLSRSIEGSTVLIPSPQRRDYLGKIHLLSETGTFILKALDGNRTVGEILEMVTREYDVSEEVAREDLIAFIALLEEMDAIHEQQPS